MTSDRKAKLFIAAVHVGLHKIALYVHTRVEYNIYRPEMAKSWRFALRDASRGANTA
jgi:hypothetical protein